LIQSAVIVRCLYQFAGNGWVTRPVRTLFDQMQFSSRVVLRQLNCRIRRAAKIQLTLHNAAWNICEPIDMVEDVVSSLKKRSWIM